jgi:hypothetical protein
MREKVTIIDMSPSKIKTRYRVEIMGKDLAIIYGKNLDTYQSAKDWRRENFHMFEERYGKPIYSHILRITNGKRKVIL